MVRNVYLYPVGCHGWFWLGVVSMIEPYLYKQNCENIIYLGQTKMQTHFADDFRHDIYTQVRDAVIRESLHAADWDERWKKSYQDLRKQGYPLNWNELKIRLAREKKPVEPETILKWMFLREQGFDIRRVIPEDESIIRELVGGVEGL